MRYSSRLLVTTTGPLCALLIVFLFATACCYAFGCYCSPAAVPYRRLAPTFLGVVVCHVCGRSCVALCCLVWCRGWGACCCFSGRTGRLQAKDLAEVVMQAIFEWNLNNDVIDAERPT